MSKLTIFLLAFYFISITVYGQNLSTEFKKISAVDMSFQPKNDPEAEAVILFDKGNSYYFESNTGYDIRFTRTKRIKVINKKGIDYAEVSIPYYVDGYGKTQHIVSINAFTYNVEEGRIFRKELDKSTVYTEKIAERVEAKKFVFPDVKEGSVVEFQYVLESPFADRLPDWEFQARIPTVYSEYEVKLIPFYEFVFLAQGINKFSHQSSSLVKGVPRSFNGIEFQDMKHTYVMKDVPPFRDESFITSRDDYIIKMDFQLASFNSPTGTKKEILTTWDEMSKSLLESDYFGKYIKKSKKQAEEILATDLDLSGQSKDEKARSIIEYVKNHYSWDSFNSKYSSKKPKEFNEQKTGNAADINLFLIALLEAAGIDARPVIISTRSHGKIKSDYPFLHFFNYLIVLVNTENQSYLTDGTDELIPYNRIPPRCMNEKGLIVQKELIEWVSLINNIDSEDHKVIHLSIDTSTLKAQAKIAIQTTEFEAYWYKHTFGNDTAELKNSLMKEGLTAINRVKTINYDRTGVPYIIGLEGESDIERIGDKLIISPFLKFPISLNSLTQKERSYPIDFTYPSTQYFQSTIEIPDGFKVTDLPENFNMDNGLAKIQIEYQLAGSTIVGTASYGFKKVVYQTSEYARIKSYFDTIVKKFNVQIVFEAM